MGELDRELKGLRGDRKMSELALQSAQNSMIEALKGDMGKDMMEVLNGDKKIELPKNEVRKFKITSWFKRLLRKF